MKKLLLISTVILALTDASGQITFQKTFGGSLDDYGYSVQQTSDGGYVIAGASYSFGVVHDDVYLIKTTATGDTLWTKTLGLLNYDAGFSVQQTGDGGYIIAGTTNSVGAGYDDIYLVKTDINGDTLWIRTIGRTWYDYGYSIQQTSDGGYIITGYTDSLSSGNGDVYLIKTDAVGNSVWTKTFGGGGGDDGWSVRQTTDGGYIIAGSTVSFGAGGGDVYLIKTNANGDTLWTRTYGNTGDDYAFSIQQTSDGGYVIAGNTDTCSAGDCSNVYLIKTDAAGNTLWAKAYGTGYGRSVKQTADGGYIIVGEGYGVYLIKTDANGNSSWSKTFGGAGINIGSSVQQTSDGGYIIAGTTNSFGAGMLDVYLIKTDSNGNSGCNEGNQATIASAPVTIVGSTASQLSSGGITGNTATKTGRGGTVNTLCTAIGITDPAKGDNEITIFPNPFVTQTILHTDKFLDNATLTVVDCLGHPVTQIKNLMGQTIVFNRDNLSSGLYFVLLAETNNIIPVVKLIITDK